MHKISITDIEDKRIEKLCDTSFYSYILRRIIYIFENILFLRL